MRLAGAALVAAMACGRIDFGNVATTGDAGSQPDAAPRASCEATPAVCGPTSSDTCCDSPLVPGGTFYRSYDGVGYDDMTNPATVDSFRLDRYEVNVARFRLFVAAGFGTQATAPQAGAGGRMLNGVASAGGWDSTWTARLPASTVALEAALACSATYQTWTDAPAGNEARPINCVDWAVAIAFCIWDGGFMPTEAEWNYAASGGDEQRAYPWSVPPGSLALDPTYASYAPTFDTDCNGDGMPGCTLDDIIPVGTRPAGNGRWGHADLAGNLYEWTLDWYQDAYMNPCDDCESTTSSYNLHGIRGGAFRYAASGLRTGYRNAWSADDRSGFRCARAP